ncbi:DUF2691 family protein [Paenibacillus spongiae]|uniref:DUF2691 family protein n=1 Tax=Paenibacillus spongiae TaxID=2909671 RepID=A0ABY5S5I2_9BACL|nr:DUF2691 family protein [Paenibacillus spongiae]UVI29161.1 DUF2691 family protein [Paenibacillus spongiae]
MAGRHPAPVRCTMFNWRIGPGEAYKLSGEELVPLFPDHIQDVEGAALLDPSTLNQLYSNAAALGVESLTFITDDNDFRTRLGVWWGFPVQDAIRGGKWGIVMGWIIWICSVVFLWVSYFEQRKKMDLQMWLTLVGVYMVCLFSLRLSGILIPVGVLIGWIYMRKTKKVYLSKVLIFGFISALVFAYVPEVSFSQMKELSQAEQYAEEFNQVRAVYHFTQGSEIHADLQTAASNLKNINPETKISTDDPHVLFSLWVLQHKNKAVKDLDWLWYEAPRELHYYWQSNRSNERVNLEYAIFNHVGYLGIFNRANEESPYYLQKVIEFDRLKNNQPLIP